jgi:hypothetical protein
MKSLPFSLLFCLLALATPEFAPASENVHTRIQDFNASRLFSSNSIPIFRGELDSRKPNQCDCLSVSSNAVGSLAVFTNNGSVELQADSVQVLSHPNFGFLDDNLKYTSVSGHDDTFIISATTADGKSTVEVTIYLSPSVGTYAIAYAGATDNLDLSPTVEVTDVAGYVKGTLVSDGDGWKFPATVGGAGVLVLGSDPSESEGILVFQGDVSTEAKMQAVLDGVEQIEPIAFWYTAIWIPDNSTVGGGNVFFGDQFVSYRSFAGWRWKEILTGAVTGAAVGFLIGGPAGAIAGGVIGGAGSWGVDRVVDPNNDEDNYVNSVAVGVVGGIGGGYLGPWVAGGGGGSGGAATGGSASTRHYLRLLELMDDAGRIPR